MLKVLFVCIHNSARSQMAEAFLRGLRPGHIEAESAGLEPGKINPLVVEVMREAGFDLSHCRAKGVAEMLESSPPYTHVITVCDGASAERCPVFPGNGQRLHWGFPDPSSATGSDEERRNKVRAIRDEIRHQVTTWVENLVG